MPRKIRIGFPRDYRVSGDFGAYSVGAQTTTLNFGYGIASQVGSYTISRQTAVLSATTGGGSGTPIVASSYRYGQPYLFQTVRGISEPSRLVDGVALPYENGAPTSVGPGYVYVDPISGWKWDHGGTDWIDSTQTRWGSSPFISTAVNAVSGNTAVSTYTFDITSTLQFVQTNSRWNAYYLKTSNAGVFRAIATKFSTTQAPPRIDVTYVGGATAVLANRIIASLSSGSSYPSTTAQDYILPSVIEFDAPTAAVQSATMTLTVTQHWSGTCNLQFFLCDPPVNTDTVQTGIANTALLDSGLVGHPSIVHAHRYLDGTAFTDFATTAVINTNDEAEFDPHIYNAATASNTAKLPHIHYGKWVGANSQWSLVSSTYTGENFAPLTPGLGAMRVEMLKPAGMQDGFIGGYGGSLGSNAFLYMPESTFALENHIFTRHYIRIGTPRGSPYRMPIAEKYHVYKAAGQAAWSDTGGKWGLMPDHLAYPDGGNSGASGGGFGWQLRNGWADIYQDNTGPSLGGVAASLHTYDFQSNNPSGFRYGVGSDTPYDSGLGQRGGIGAIMYADKWYCVEGEVKMNSVSSTPITISNGTPAVVTYSAHGLAPNTCLGFYTTGTLPAPLAPMTAYCAMAGGMATNAMQLWDLRTITVSQGTPCVATLTAHGFAANTPITFLTIGSLPAPLVGGTTYYVSATGLTANTFQISATSGGAVINTTTTGTSTHKVAGGTPIATTSVGSGVHTMSYAADGEVRQWIDGRLALQRTQMVFRSLPTYISVSGVATTPTFQRSGANRAVRDVGIKSIWFNWFHGGLTQNTVDRTLFVTGVAVSHAYIGPMQLPTSSLPSWVPAVGESALLTTTNGLLTNKLKDVCAPYYQETQFWNIRDGDSGPVVNKYWGTYGGVVIHGAGHASTNDNTVAILEFGSNNCTFKRLTNPTAHYGTGTDATTKSNNSTGTTNRDGTWGEYTLDGQPCASHTYGALDILPPVNGGAANGSLIKIMSVAQAHAGGLDSIAAHKLDFPTSTGAAGSYTWSRLGTSPIGDVTVAQPIPCWTMYIPAQNRTYYEAHWAGRTPRWFNHATNAFEVGTGTARNQSLVVGPYTGIMCHAIGRNLLLHASAESGNVVAIRYLPVSSTDTNPNWSSAVTLSIPIPVGTGFSALGWCSDNNKLYAGTPGSFASPDQTGVYEITIPTVLSDAWTVVRRSFTTPIPWPTQTGTEYGSPAFKSWDYNPATKCFVAFLIANTAGGSDTVAVYRPPGT